MRRWRGCLCILIAGIAAGITTSAATGIAPPLSLSPILRVLAVEEETTFSSHFALAPSNVTSPWYGNGTSDFGETWRKAHFDVVVASAAAQGIGGAGAGDFECEKARYELLAAGGAADPAPSTTFNVLAAARWSPSGFAVQAGETYNVVTAGAATATANQTSWSDGAIATNAWGYDASYDAVAQCYVARGRCHPHLGREPARLPAPWGRRMQLICGVGRFVTTLQEAAPVVLRTMPVEESELLSSLMAIGANRTFVAAHWGELVCFANDADGRYFDNSGSVNVTVTRVSWPPDASFTAGYLSYLS